MKNWKSITAGVSCLSMLLTAGMSTTSAAEITEIPEQSIVYWSMWEENEPQADVIKEAAEDYEAATGISVEIEWKGREIQSLIEPALDAGEQIDQLNKPVMEDRALWNEIMKQTPLKRWMTVEEAADWAYFMTVTNRFCTGQNILIDGLEAGNAHFVWPEE